MKKKVKIIVTLGPSTNTEEDLRKIKDKGVDFVRINMSHSSIDDLKQAIKMAKKVDIPFIIDTEGSQIRTGYLSTNKVYLEENQTIKIYAEPIVGDNTKLSLKPSFVVEQLEVGDIIQVDFDTLALTVSDTSTLHDGYILARAVSGGEVGRNKGVVIHPAFERTITLPTLSEKDYQSINLGLEEGIGHIAASFMRSGKAVEEVRRATQNTMKIISKVECTDALENLDEITKKSDYLLIDRGDLSKEIAIEKIPFTQKIILNKAKKYNTPVFVATNLLETMTEKRKPTRAEVHDIINTIVDGAYGLTLAGETAIGKYPMACINMLNKLIMHSQLAIDVEHFDQKEDSFVQKLLEKNYLTSTEISSSLVPPHGGKLVNRMLKTLPEAIYVDKLPQIKLNQNKQMDVEQIALGTYSPIEGFMNEKDFLTVLDDMRLADGTIWPMPIVLDVTQEEAAKLSVGQEVALVGEKGVMALLHLEEKYNFDKQNMSIKMYSTNNEEHPGVKAVNQMNPILLGGKISLIKRRNSEHKEFELTPKQSRHLFEERGWSKVVGFHTRNVIHRGHEFLQMTALQRTNCDGLFVHPVVGKKKQGDFNAKYIVKAYEKMIENFYPKNTAIFGTFCTYSRYAGPREALFTALCRKNFGCSHFIVGRDHTGVKDFYHPKASHNIFERFPDLGIVPVRFDKVFYSKKLEKHVEAKDYPYLEEEDQLHISGTQARKMFESGERPPEWFMRPEIAQIVLDAVEKQEEVFVKN